MTSTRLAPPPITVLRATALVVLCVLAAASVAVGMTVLFAHAGVLLTVILGALVAPLVPPAVVVALAARRRRRATEHASANPEVSAEAARGIREIEQWLAAIPFGPDLPAA